MSSKIFVDYRDHLRAYNFKMFLYRFGIKTAITSKWREHVAKHGIDIR